MSTTSGRVFVGVDWATREHDVCIEDASGKVLREFRVRHTADALGDLCDQIDSLCAGDREHAHVAIEVPHGIIVDTLLDRGYRVFSINPKQLDRFRDRFSPSGAKDDTRDARVLADSLRTDERAFRCLETADPKVIELREWSRMHDELKQEHTRLANAFRDQLRRYYPTFLEVGADVGTPCGLALWLLVPSPRAARKAKRGDVQQLLKQHRIRKTDAKTVLNTLCQPSLRSAPGVSEAAQAHLTLLCERLATINAQTRTCQRRIAEILAEMTPVRAAETDDETAESREQHDVAIALSMPGIGPIVLAALLAEAHGPLRERDYQALRSLSGAAPVTQASGKRKGKRAFVLMRRACNPRLRNAIYHWARVAAQCDELAKARYTALRQRGKSHGQALRSVADRLLGVLCAMLRDQTTYRPPSIQAA